MKLLGYLTLYIRIETKEAEPSYIKMQFDFRKPFTRHAAKKILKSAKKTVSNVGFTPIRAYFVSKEEYEKSQTQTIASHSWGEDSLDDVHAESPLEHCINVESWKRK